MEPNWTDVVTPIKVDNLWKALLEVGYEEQRITTLVNGFSKGFDIRYRGPMKRRNLSSKLPFRIGSKTELWNKVMKEVKEHRYAGPFECPPQ